MSDSIFYKGFGPVAIYRMHMALMRLLESVKRNYSEDAYQDMYAKLLQIGRERIVELHASLEAGKTREVLNFLGKGVVKEQRLPESDLQTRRHNRRKKLRRALKGSAN